MHRVLKFGLCASVSVRMLLEEDTYHTCIIYASLSYSFNVRMYTLQRTSGSAANKIVLSMHVFVCFIHRVGQNHTFIGIYGVYTVLSAGRSPYIRSYTVCIYGSGQPYA